MKVRFTDTSEQHFEAFADHLVRDDADYALIFVTSLPDSCRQIGDHPHLYPIVRGIGPGDLRRRLVWPYLIFYRVENGIVFIHGLVHRIPQRRRDIRAPVITKRAARCRTALPPAGASRHPQS